MKKYVLNIEKLFAGDTANALVLNQVDKDFPILLPSVPAGTINWNAWIQKFKKIHPSFNPESISSLEELNDYIIEFNLNLQTKFKDSGHQELYMMDDTKGMNPNERDFSQGKTYLHCLNGTARMEDEDDGEGEQVVNSSQMNVLFPFKKMTSKSLYASQLKVETQRSIDDSLERSRGITIQGKVSYENCVKAVVQVGGNLYMMSPTIDLGIDAFHRHIHGNGLTIVNGYDFPYHFPHSMTLFQPGQKQYDGENLVEEDTGFIEWYRNHSRKTVVSFKETYGGNVSYLKCLGTGSYELELSTYSPTGIVVRGSNGEETWKTFDTDSLRGIRLEESDSDRYESGKYIFDNGDGDDLPDVGLMFNMYDTFITGNDRILKLTVPQDEDFNELLLSFEWEVLNGLPGYLEATVQVNEETAFTYNSDENGSEMEGEFSYEIRQASVKEHDVTITVRIHYDVDFGKRNTEQDYREKLKASGVLLNNIRVESEKDKSPKRLTFGSYVNETGLSDVQRKARQEEFWLVSQYKQNMAYQTVLESPLRNITTLGILYPNNYSTGDIYGDLFVTKSVLNPRYDMEIDGVFKFNENSWNWDDKGVGKDMMRAVGRDYIGMGSCSNQLSLLYHPTDIAIEYGKNDDTVYARRLDDGGSELKYQMVEVVRNINRFESAIKHKSNVFSVVVENSNLAADESGDEEVEKYKSRLRDAITQFVRSTCEGVVPVHTQLFDVQFT